MSTMLLSNVKVGDVISYVIGDPVNMPGQGELTENGFGYAHGDPANLYFKSSQSLVVGKWDKDVLLLAHLNSRHMAQLNVARYRFVLREVRTPTIEELLLCKNPYINEFVGAISKRLLETYEQ